MTEIKQISCKMVNTYLLKGKNGAVLVDTGETADQEKILKACENENVRLLLLTHGHIDHIQNGAYLAQQLHVPIAMHPKDAELIRNQFAQAMESTGLFGKILAAASKSKMKKNQIEPFDPELFLQEGDSLEPYGVQASVMELPGHTKGSIGLDVEGRAVIAGDALMHMLRPGEASIYADREKLKESAKRITALGNRTIYFGHGMPVPNRNWISD